MSSPGRRKRTLASALCPCPAGHFLRALPLSFLVEADDEFHFVTGIQGVNANQVCSVDEEVFSVRNFDEPEPLQVIPTLDLK